MGCAGVKTEQNKMGTLLFCSQQVMKISIANNTIQELEIIPIVAWKVWIKFAEQSG